MNKDMMNRGPAVKAAPVFSFNFPLGTEFIDIPSQGKLYLEDSPLFGISEIEIKQMSGKDEEILANKNYIKKGIVIDKLLANLIVDKNIVNNLQDMLAADKAALFVAARITGISDEYATEIICPQCDTRQRYNFDLNKSTLYHGYEEDTEDIQKIQNNVFRVTLPASKVKVDIRLSTSRDSDKMLKLAQGNKVIVNNDVLGDLVVAIITPDGTSFTDSTSKLLFFENVPAKELLFLKHKIKEVNPDFSLMQEFNCENCSYVGELEPPFTVNFIYPK